MANKTYWSPLTGVTYNSLEMKQTMEQDYLNKRLINEIKKANGTDMWSNIARQAQQTINNRNVTNKKGTGFHTLMVFIDVILFIGGWAILLNSQMNDEQFIPIGLTGSAILAVLALYHMSKSE